MNESNQDPLAQQDRKSIKITGEQVQTIIEWLSWADKDYVAARRLLLDGLLVQGASLANTAIEKYLKASIVCQGKKVKRGHDPLTIYRQMKSDCTLQLNEKFLALLAKAYKLRYPDDLEAGYNVVLSQALILDALDQSVKLITSRIVIANSSNGHAVVRLLDNLIAQNDPRVVFNNTALGTVTKDALLDQPSLVYECRVIQKHSYMEAEYSAARIENGNFDREALVQTSEKSFNLANTPTQ
jgi:HEPN domain-containing protein